MQKPSSEKFLLYLPEENSKGTDSGRKI